MEPQNEWIEWNRSFLAACWTPERMIRASFWVSYLKWDRSVFNKLKKPPVRDEYWWILMNCLKTDEFIHQIYENSSKRKNKFITSRKVRKSDETDESSSKFIKFLVMNHRFITQNDELMNLMNWLVMNKVTIHQWWIKFITS